MNLLHFYRTPALTHAKKDPLLLKIKRDILPEIVDIETEYCFNIETISTLTDDELNILRWLLAETFEPEKFCSRSFLTNDSGHERSSNKCNAKQIAPTDFLFEVGPRLNFTTAWSTNAVSVCHACGLTKIRRIESRGDIN